MATNPYDRREEPTRRTRRGSPGELVDVGAAYHFDQLADGRAAYPGFTLGKLEEVLRDEFARGFNAGEGTMERKLEEEILPRAQRRVWDEGHAAGMDDGEAATLTRVEELFGVVVRELLADFEPVLADEGAHVENFRPLAYRAHRLLAQLVEAHHGGFAHPVPF